MREIAESDWKQLRKLQPIALERLCARIIHEAVGDAAISGETSHEKFLKLLSVVEKGNSAIVLAFDDLRRSTAFGKLIEMRAQGLITDTELQQFSEAIRSKIRQVEEGRKDA